MLVSHREGKVGPELLAASSLLSIRIVDNMAAVAARPSNNRRTTRGPKRAVEDERKSIWSEMLESVGRGKRLEEKTLLVLGET